VLSARADVAWVQAHRGDLDAAGEVGGLLVRAGSLQADAATESRVRQTLSRSTYSDIPRIHHGSRSGTLVEVNHQPVDRREPTKENHMHTRNLCHPLAATGLARAALGLIACPAHAGIRESGATA
jgi:hypothetical protein